MTPWRRACRISRLPLSETPEHPSELEYIEGESLGGLMRRMWLGGEALDRMLAAHVIAEACAGLHAAHELTDITGSGRQVIHRDVSPQNVMITYAGEVKVLDFGIAKAADTARTEGGQVKGKCEYMSPEQCSSGPLDRRSDIFSLGVLLYELTVGRRLFKRASEMQVFQAICQEPILRPTEIDPAYPEQLAAICDRALARDPRDRYATMIEMRRDLVAAIRRIRGHDEERDEEELLGRVMTRLFADRIHDKRDMLQQVQTGSPVVNIPVAEADTQVELPEVGQPVHGPPRATATTLSALRARLRRGRGRLLWGAAALAAVLGVAGIWGGRMSRKDPVESATPGVKAETAPVSADCGVRDYDNKLYCSNREDAPTHSEPRGSSPIVNHLPMTRNWFTCWVQGEKGRGSTTWYYTLGDATQNWGWVEGRELFTPPGFNDNPSAFGLRYCPSDPAPERRR